MDLDDNDDTPITDALRIYIQFGLFPFLCSFLSKKWATVQQNILMAWTQGNEKKMGIPIIY